MLHKLLALTTFVMGINAQTKLATSAIVPNAIVPEGAPKEVNGLLKLELVKDNTKISGFISGLKPNTEYGFHVHELGLIGDVGRPGNRMVINCDKAGGHYNPFGKGHGAPNAEERHVGDLGNIKTDREGVADVNIVDRLVKLNGETSVIGRAFVVHEKADNLKPDMEVAGGVSFGEPSKNGNAGKRLACGVIGAAEKPKIITEGNPQPGKPSPKPTDAPKAAAIKTCIGRRRNGHFRYIYKSNDRKQLGKGMNSCRKLYIKEQNKCDDNIKGNCVSIQTLKNGNPDKYLSSETADNGELKNKMEKNELWKMNYRSDGKFSLYNLGKGRFLCNEWNGKTENNRKYRLKFRRSTSNNDDKIKCFWEQSTMDKLVRRLS